MLSLIDNKTELLELINRCLKPKHEEKQKFGEVFTPMWIIETRLYDNLKLDDPLVFTRPDKKWYDQACGMGNFSIALYYRLMDGLKDVIVDVSRGIIFC